MSCFEGQMKLYTEISIDRFDGPNLNAAAYFLSHCHTDHMVGLSSQNLQIKLQVNPHIKLFVSETTKILLLEDSRFYFLEPNIEVLAIEEPKIISLIDNNGDVKRITITLIPAGHCLGSVMFLFEGEEGCCLYTGDLRLPKGSAARIKHLHSGTNVVKQVDHLHIDTTFCIPDAFYIPGREECLNALISLVDSWISKGSSHIVRMNLSAKYGYEYLYEALHHRFGVKVYCSRANQYKKLPHIAAILTDDPTRSQIYACFKTEKVAGQDWSQWCDSVDSDTQTLRTDRKLKFLYITLSTMYFTHAAAPEEVKVRIGGSHYRLCFSFHSSLSEVCDFIRYIKPGHIHANVIPRPEDTFESVEERLTKLCFGGDHSRKSKSVSSYKPVGKLHDALDCRRVKDSAEKSRKFAVLSNSDSEDDFSFVTKRRRNKT